jgi:sigma-B regulation protein RsbU (phosphoserine phosphatase)
MSDPAVAQATHDELNRSRLAHVPIFSSLPPEAIPSVAGMVQFRAYPAGDVLTREGEPGDRLYVVLTGQIEIIKALGTPDERLLNVCTTGDVLGEMGLIDLDNRRSASVRVRDDAQVIEIGRNEFDLLLKRYPAIAYDMLRVLTARLRASDEATIRDLQQKNQELSVAYAELQAAQARLIEQQALERELNHAREIQESMLPAALPAVNGVEIGASIIPARMVGGDLYDVLEMGPDRVAFVIGDVSGKGVPAALFMALTCSLLRATVEDSPEPLRMLDRVNHHLFQRNSRSMFVSLLVAVFHRPSREVSLLRAGHEPPLIWDARGSFWEPEAGRSLPLGLFPTSVVDMQRVALLPGSTLLMFTDGVTDAMDANGVRFGRERIRAAAAAHADLAAQPLCLQIITALEAHRGAAAQTDDITMLALRVD